MGTKEDVAELEEVLLTYFREFEGRTGRRVQSVQLLRDYLFRSGAAATSDGTEIGAELAGVSVDLSEAGSPARVLKEATIATDDENIN